MCGRYTLAAPAATIAEIFGVGVPVTLAKRFNIAPTQPVLAVRQVSAGHREAVILRWGLIPAWAADASIGPRLINARSETAAEKPAFRASFRSYRCLIVADGFYEWQPRDGRKQPFLIRASSGLPFGFGGLWARWERQGVEIESCTILTCAANEPMRAIHDRMPVVIPPESHAAWLDPALHDPARLTPLLRPFHPSEMTSYPVGTLVNNVRNDSPQCLEPLPAPGA